MEQENCRMSFLIAGGHDFCGGFNMLGPGSGTILEVCPSWSRCVLVGRCTTVDVGFKTLLLAAWKPVFY